MLTGAVLSRAVLTGVVLTAAVQTEAALRAKESLPAWPDVAPAARSGGPYRFQSLGCTGVQGRRSSCSGRDRSGQQACSTTGSQHLTNCREFRSRQRPHRAQSRASDAHPRRQDGPART
ncbi:MAG: hypothetical protein ACR2QO_19645 [Acidimicrobiales bacterium]